MVVNVGSDDVVCWIGLLEIGCKFTGVVACSTGVLAIGCEFNVFKVCLIGAVEIGLILNDVDDDKGCYCTETEVDGVRITVTVYWIPHFLVVVL